jgi:hypothetical protein
MAAEGDPDPIGVPPPAAFYGLWPKFADPSRDGRAAVPPRRDHPRRDAVEDSARLA